MPEKDLIMEISRQRDQMLCAEVDGPIPDGKQTTTKGGSFIEI